MGIFQQILSSCSCAATAIRCDSMRGVCRCGWWYVRCGWLKPERIKMRGGKFSLPLPVRVGYLYLLCDH